MTWFSFTGGYGTINFGTAAEKEAVTLGFHGYATEAQAKAHPNSVNAIQAPLLDTLIAQQAGAIPSPTGGISTAAGAGAGSWALKVTGVSGWFMRALKIVFGGVLMIIGVSKLTGADNAIVQLASKVPVVPV